MNPTHHVIEGTVCHASDSSAVVHLQFVLPRDVVFSLNLYKLAIREFARQQRDSTRRRGPVDADPPPQVRLRNQYGPLSEIFESMEPLSAATFTDVWLDSLSNEAIEHDKISITANLSRTRTVTAHHGNTTTWTTGSADVSHTLTIASKDPSRPVYSNVIQTVTTNECYAIAASSEQANRRAFIKLISHFMQHSPLKYSHFFAVISSLSGTGQNYTGLIEPGRINVALLHGAADVNPRPLQVRDDLEPHRLFFIFFVCTPMENNHTPTLSTLVIDCAELHQPDYFENAAQFQLDAFNRVARPDVRASMDSLFIGRNRIEPEVMLSVISERLYEYAEVAQAHVLDFDPNAVPITMDANPICGSILASVSSGQTSRQLDPHLHFEGGMTARLGTSQRSVTIQQHSSRRRGCIIS